MRHLSVTQYGQFLGISGQCLQVKEKGEIVTETPLSRLRTITISREGVSISSNLILSCAQRGIRIFIQDWKGANVAAISGQHQHAIAALRKAQFNYLESRDSHTVAAGMIYGKIRNQRSVLLYFAKYLRKSDPDKLPLLQASVSTIEQQAEALRTINWPAHEQWRQEIMGYEGIAAKAYWQALVNSGLLPESFEQRQGRGATEITNQALNYGYTMLTSYIWTALDNAGFEVYAGLLHTQRAGKPSLVLDMMEEYRPWVVDRNVIKLRKKMLTQAVLDQKIKKILSNMIHKTMQTHYMFHGKRLKLETIIQRQAYRLASSIIDNKRYQPYRFKW